MSNTRMKTLPFRAAAEPKAVEAMLSFDGIASMLNCSRRTVEKMRLERKLPAPDWRRGRLLRWWPSTIRRWIDEK
jgi:hypothetical protein